MKRCLLFIIVLFLSAAAAFAQNEPRNQGQVPPETDSGSGRSRSAVSIQGVLSFVNGRIAVKSGETTYYVWGLDRLFGFVDGLKEGSSVTLEGYASEIPGAPEYGRFLAEKLSFDGREYAGLLPGKRAEPANSGVRVFPPPGRMTHNRGTSRRPPSSYRKNR
jgi:hypothetical protein